MKSTRTVLVMAAILFIGAQAEAKKVKLEYHLKAGDKFAYETTSKQEMTQEMMGQSQTIVNESTTTYGFKVNSVSAEGNIDLDASLVAYAMTSTTPMGEVKFNSVTDTVVPDFAKAMIITMNEVYNVTLSPLGKVLGVKAPANIEDKVSKAMQALAGGAPDMAAEAAAHAASAEGFRKVIEGMFITFPEGGAQLNTPWQSQSSIEQMVRLLTQSKYELTASSKEGNELKVTTSITQDPQAPPVDLQGMTMHYELVGSRDGKMMLDPETGLVKSGEGVMAVSGTIAIESPQLPSPMSIPMTIKVTDKTVRK